MTEAEIVEAEIVEAEIAEIVVGDWNGARRAGSP
jgi:hypothetical protein